MSTETPEIPAGLLLLREEVPAKLVGKLPKVTCFDCKKKENRGECQRHRKTKCLTCGSYMSPDHIHLEYVGHAETTSRLLDADIEWNWEPVAWGQDGLPQFDADGGLWIKLTVCGVTRLGYGTADNANGFKSRGDIRKEIIGDALRNASMRFGHALNLWAKTDIHAAAEGTEDEPQQSQPDPRTEAVASAGSRTQRTHVDAPTAAPAAPSVRPSTTQQQKMIAILFEKKLNVRDRDERLKMVGDSLGRSIKSTTELTYDEAQNGLIWLGEMADFVPPAQFSPTATDGLYHEFVVGIEGSASVPELQSVATGITSAFQAGKLTEADRKALIAAWTERNKVLLDQARMAGAL